MEAGARNYFAIIDRMGGMVEAIEEGFPQKEICRSVVPVPAGGREPRKVIVGVNDFVQDDECRSRRCTSTSPPATGRWPASIELRKTRDNAEVRRALEVFRRPPRGTGNTMYPLMDCVRAYATVGEMCDALREVWGEYEEVPLI